MDADVKEAALLAEDCYKKRNKGDQATIGGISYVILTITDKKSGYQATAYQRADTGHVIIAERGTEFGREPIRDGVQADGGMVRDGINSQYNDAIVFTEDVIREAKKTEPRFGHPITFSTTGHSLGGTLAQIISEKYNLPGITFNAYGAAGLNYGIPEGGHLVKNYICATDLVSAASPQFGETHIYASQQDIDRLKQGHYLDSPSKGTEPNPFMTLSVTAHRMGNFLPHNDILGQSLISPENEARAQAYKAEIDAYRSHIQQNREVVATYLKNREAGAPDPVNQEAMEKLRSQAFDAAVAPAQEAHAKGKEKIAQIIDQGLTTAEWAQKKVVDTATHASHAMDHATDAIKQQAQETYSGIKHSAEELQHRTKVSVDSAVEQTTKAIQQGVDAVHRKAQAASEAIDEGVDHAKAKARAAGEAVSAAAQSVSDGFSQVGTKLGSLFADNTTAPSLHHSTHPDHALYNDALKAVKHLDASQNRAPDHRSERLAAALTVASRREGLSGIDHVVLSDDASRAFGIQGELRSPSMRAAHVDTAWAVRTPIEQHSQDWQQLAHTHHETQQQQMHHQTHPKAQQPGSAHAM